MFEENNFYKQRAIHDKDFTIANNEIFRYKDKKGKPLDLTTIGLYFRILSLPPTWIFNIKGLCSICGCSRDKLMTSLDKLQELGYMQRFKKPYKGKFDNNQFAYRFNETIDQSLWCIEEITKETTCDLSQNKTNLISDVGNSEVGKLEVGKFDFGISDTIKDISNKVNNNKVLFSNKELNNNYNNIYSKGILFSNNLNNTSFSNNLNNNLNNLNKLTKLNNFSSLTKLSNALTFLNNYLEINSDKIDKIDVTKLNKFLENKFENLILNEKDEIINSENIQVENENIESEDEEMNIPRNIKKPKPLKGIKKEIPQESLDTLLENNPNVDKLGNMTDEQKENANLKKQLNEIKEQNSELKTKIAKASVKKKKALQYIDKMYAKDPVMSNLLVSFVEMFVQSRGSITEQALKLHLENLNSLSTDRNEQIEIIKNSIMKNYLGFYPVPNSNSKVSNIENNKGKISDVYKNTSLDKNALQNELDGGNEETDELLMDLDAYFSNLQE